MKKLVGEGKPLHSAVDRAAKGLKRKVGTGAEFMKELMGITGIKPTEIQERGLNEVMGMPRMTHDQFMAELGKKPAPAVRELTFTDKPDPLSTEELRREANNLIRERAREYADEGSDSSGEYRRLAADEMRRLRSNHMGQALRIAQENNLQYSTSPYHGQYTLPGGENYREMLIKSPEESGEIFAGNSGHFGGEPGILASMRVKDRTGPNGEKLLHLEELQSDWHQQGRDKGYQGDVPDLTPEQKARIEELGDKIRRGVGTSAEIDESKALRDQLAKKRNAVPDAPLKKNWEEMALKRLIHHAAEKGYHGIVVTPGAEQADRYSLAKHVDEISHYPRTSAITGEKSKSIRIDMKRGNPVQLGVNSEGVVDNVNNSEHENLKGKHISDIVGKEHAKNIMSQERGEISGEGLTVGGEGMKAFYDKKVPNILNSIGKKYGVKTQLHGHKLPGDPSQRGDASERLGVAHVPLAGMSPEQVQAFNQKLDDSNAKQLHYFPITEEMRKDVLTNGLPLYAQGGTVHMAKGDDMDTMKLEMMRRHMATGGKAKATKGYVTHEPKNPHPEVGTRFKATPQGNLAPMQAFDLMKHEGKGSIVPIPYDATTRDNLVTEVSGNKLINPLLTEAGFDYSLDKSNMAQDIGGASNSAIARRVQDRVDQAAREHKGDVFLAPNIMGEDAENFSHHPAHIVLDLMAQRQLNPNTLQALSDDLRGQFELKRNAKTGAVTKIYPYTKFVGYHHPKLMEQVTKGGHGLETTAGNLRKKMMERLSLVNMQKLLDYNMGDLKAAILDPELATDPKAYMGRTMVKAQPGAALRPSKHTSYDTDYTGINVGGLGPNRPLEILMPDVYEDINAELTARPAKTVKTPAQMRAQVVGALEKRKEKFAQPINARVINNAGLYAEGLSQGEFDPKNVDSVLAYFKRKGGYADGGIVNTKSIGVQEAPNMDIKAYFPPEPVRQGNVLPIGGVEQPQQAPQQPQQGAPAPQGMPQGMPPQGAPAQQSPSNILQMTRQGQAMNAMTPPAPQPQGMARGGTTRRVAYNSDPDAMMLELMQAKRYSNRK